MSIGNEIAYRRSAWAKEATGSLVFDAERRRAQARGKDADKSAGAARRSTTKQKLD